MKLAEQDSSNAQWKLDLSVVLKKIGALHEAQGDLGLALDSYTETRDISVKLAQSDPSSTQWQEDLSLSLVKIADIHLARSGQSAALHSFAESRDFLERLAQENPSNAQWLRGLSLSRIRIEEATRHVQESLPLLCDRDRAVAAFEDVVRRRLDTHRPGCLIVFGEVDQGHVALFDRIKLHMLTRSSDRTRYRNIEFFISPPQESVPRQQEGLRSIVIDTAERGLGVEIGSCDEIYRTLHRREVSLCVLNVLVHVTSKAQARWWISGLEQLQEEFPRLEQTGPEVILVLSVMYPRRRGLWSLRTVDWGMREFLSKLLPSDSLTTINTLGIHLASVTRSDVANWCADPQVRSRISRINRDQFFRPFKSSHECPMDDVLAHLRSVLRDNRE
jgi:hypothetical protein